MALDAREQAFVHEYIINGGNAYQAALKAACGIAAKKRSQCITDCRQAMCRIAAQ